MNLLMGMTNKYLSAESGMVNEDTEVFTDDKVVLYAERKFYRKIMVIKSYL